MVLELYKKLNILKDLPNEMYFDFLMTNSQELIIFLSTEEKDPIDRRYLKIRFDDYLFYKGADESKCISSVNKIFKNAKNKSNFPWPIHVVENSSLIEWFKDESAHLYNGDIQHFHVVSINEIIEILNYGGITVTVYLIQASC